MNLEPFNHARKQWDRFKEFYHPADLISSRYYYHEPFIQFETGEFIVTQSYFKPRYRKLYEAFNVSIMHSDDWHWQKLLNDKRLTTPDGDEVKRSWLNNRGAHSLWIDHDSGHVVDLGIDAKENQRIPKRFRTAAYVYYAAPNEAPISNGTIDVVEVDKLNADEKAHVSTLVAQCKAWDALSEEAKIPPGREHSIYSSTIYDANTRAYVTNQCFVPTAKVSVSYLLNEAKTFDDLIWQTRKRIVMRGIESRRKTTNFSHLILTNR